MRGHRQGMIRNPAEVALYDYGALGMEMHGLGVDLGGFGEIAENVSEAVDNLPSWAKLLGVVGAGLGAYAVVSGKVKLGGKKKRRNSSKRRKSTRRRRR